MTLRYDQVVESVAAAATVLGAWLAISPFLIGPSPHRAENAAFGIAITAISAFYFVQIRRDPEVRVQTLWFLLVLAGILLGGTLLVPPHNGLFFWTTVVAAALLFVLVSTVVVWGSRFGPDGNAETTIYDR